MALISKKNFKTVLGAADLTLTAKAGQSILIKDVRIYSPTVVYANFLIERTAIGFFRVASLLGNHLHFGPGRASHSHDWYFGTAEGTMGDVGSFIENAGEADTAVALTQAAADTNYLRVPHMTETPSSFRQTLLSYLGSRGLFSGYPVAEGETFTLDLITGATAIKMVEYELYAAGDISNEMDNGSKSSTFVFVSYGDTGANLQLVVDTTLGESNNPAEYPDFPFGSLVPSGHKIELLGILASDVGPAANVTGTYSMTQYLKLMRGREVLFDEDHNGLLYYNPQQDPPGAVNLIGEGYSPGGNFTQCDIKQPLMFDPPLTFLEGEELSVIWHIANDGTTGVVISQALQEVGMILKLSPI